MEETKKENKFARMSAMDGFSNRMSRTGVGHEIDNQLSHSEYTFNLLTRNRVQLEAMYRGSWAVGVVVDAVAEDMTRAGIKITTSEEAKSIEDFNVALGNLGIMSAFQKLKKWARLYGGALGVIMIDGQDLSSPLKIDRIKKGQFSGIQVYDRWQLIPDLSTVIRTGPDAGLPAYYTIVTSDVLIEQGVGKDNESGTISNIDYSNVNGGIRVHHSRCIRQVGVELPYFQAITEQWWGMSVIERLLDRLFSFDNATLSAGNLINHANLRTIAVDGLREAIASGGKALEGLMSFFDMVREMQSNEGLTVIDKEDVPTTTSYTFAGLSDLMLQFGQQLSGAAGIPLVRFFGQSPAGLNATGESDFRMYYDNINSLQEADFRRPLEKVLKIAFISTFGRPAPKDMAFKFISLWQTSTSQKAIDARTTTETVIGAFESGVVKRSVAMKELRQQSNETGLFTNISDEDIREAEEDDKLQLSSGEVPGEEELEKNFKYEEPGNEALEENKAKDSKKRNWLMRFFSKDADFNEEDHPRNENGEFSKGGGSSKKPKKNKEDKEKKISKKENNKRKPGESVSEKGDQAIKKLEDQGFTFEYFEQYGGDIGVEVKKDGKYAGHAIFRPQKNGKLETHPYEQVKVDKEFRRMGVASGMYAFIEKESGKTLQPAKTQNELGKSIWSNPNRPFGDL